MCQIGISKKDIFLVKKFKAKKKKKGIAKKRVWRLQVGSAKQAMKIKINR